MKRGTPRHPKVLGLSVALGIPQYAVVGLLEMLWHFAAEFAIDGGVGKFTDEMIAKALCWDGDSAILIDALANEGWIDRCQCHRLRVHDWPNHADQTVQRVLVNRNQEFLPCYDDPGTVLEPSKLPLPKPIPKANTNTGTRVRDRSIREGFDAFWQVYPNRKAKKDAQKAWKQTASDRPAMPVLLAAIRSQCKTDQWQRGIIPLPASWLRGARWADEGGAKLGPATGRPIPKCDPIVEDVPETAEEEAERMAAAKAAIDAMKKLGQGMSLPEGEES